MYVYMYILCVSESQRIEGNFPFPQDWPKAAVLMPYRSFCRNSRSSYILVQRIPPHTIHIYMYTRVLYTYISRLGFSW